VVEEVPEPVCCFLFVVTAGEPEVGEVGLCFLLRYEREVGKEKSEKLVGVSDTV
jgi:hypothetical protein